MMRMKGWRMKKMKTCRWVTGFHCMSMCQHWTGLCLVVNVWVHAAMAKPELPAETLALTREMADSSLEYFGILHPHSPCILLYPTRTDWFYSHQPPQAVQLPTPGSLTSPNITGNQLRIQLFAVGIFIPNNRNNFMQWLIILGILINGLVLVGWRGLKDWFESWRENTWTGYTGTGRIRGLFILGGGCYMCWLCKIRLVVCAASAATPRGKTTQRAPTFTKQHFSPCIRTLVYNTILCLGSCNTRLHNRKSMDFGFDLWKIKFLQELRRSPKLTHLFLDPLSTVPENLIKIVHNNLLLCWQRNKGRLSDRLLGGVNKLRKERDIFIQRDCCFAQAWSFQDIYLPK